MWHQILPCIPRLSQNVKKRSRHVHVNCIAQSTLAQFKDEHNRPDFEPLQRPLVQRL